MLYNLILSPLLSSHVSCQNLCLQTVTEKLSLPLRQPHFYPQEEEKLFSLFWAWCLFLLKDAPLVPGPPSLPFLSFPTEILSSALLACCQVYRNALNLICEGHQMRAPYFLMYLCKCVPSPVCLFISWWLKISPSYEPLCVHFCVVALWLRVLACVACLSSVSWWELNVVIFYH